MLIQCPECGHKISDKAEICVSCGFGIKQYLEDMRREQEMIQEKEEQKLIDLQDFEKIKQQIQLPQKPQKEVVSDKFNSDRNFGIYILIVGIIISGVIIIAVINDVSLSFWFWIIGIFCLIMGNFMIKDACASKKAQEKDNQRNYDNAVKAYIQIMQNPQAYIENQAKKRWEYKQYNIPMECPKCKQTDIEQWSIGEESGACTCKKCYYEHIYDAAQNKKHKAHINQLYQEMKQSSTQSKCSKCGSTAGFIPIRKKWDVVTGYRTNKIEMVCKNCGAVKR